MRATNGSRSVDCELISDRLPKPADTRLVGVRVNSAKVFATDPTAIRRGVALATVLPEGYR